MKSSAPHRLCEALGQLLDDSEMGYAQDDTLQLRIQVIVDQLIQLAEDPAVKDQLQEPMQILLGRWQQQIHARSVQLMQLHAEIERINQSRAQLTGFSSSYRRDTASQFSRLRAMA